MEINLGGFTKNALSASGFIIVFLLILLLLPYEAHCEKYVTYGYREDHGFPENGTTGIWLMEKEYTVYIPDGLTVEIEQKYKPINPETVFVTLPGCNDYVVSLNRSNLIKIEEYPFAIDRPFLTLERETKLFTSPTKENDYLMRTIPTGETVSIIAATQNTYYVKTEHNMYGFIDKEVSVFKETPMHRIYNEYMTYVEAIYDEPTTSYSMVIDENEALTLAQEFILANFQDETAEHLDSLSCDVRINGAHEFGAWGVTWQVIYYGEADRWLRKNKYLFVPSDHAMSPIYAPQFMDNDYSLKTDLEQDEVKTVEELWHGNINQYHIHYVITVLNNRKCYILAVSAKTHLNQFAKKPANT